MPTVDPSLLRRLIESQSENVANQLIATSPQLLSDDALTKLEHVAATGSFVEGTRARQLIQLIGDQRFKVRDNAAIGAMRSFHDSKDKADADVAVRLLSSGLSDRWLPEHRRHHVLASLGYVLLQIYTETNQKQRATLEQAHRYLMEASKLRVLEFADGLSVEGNLKACEQLMAEITPRQEPESS